jgi:amidase
MAHFQQLTRDFVKFYESYDVWLTPTIPMEPPKIGFISHDSPFEQTRERNMQVMSYSQVANIVGAPAMSVPLLHSATSGLPIGSHFMAAAGADKLLYELAYELEAAQPWAARWAPFSAKFKG